MPSAKRGTVTSDLAKAIREAKGGLDWLGVPTGSTKKGKKSSSEKGVISVPIGRITFTEEQVAENVAQFAKQVENVLNGVGTQAEIGEDTSERKRGQIEKLLLGKSRSFSVEVTDFKDLIKNASSTTSASSPEHVTA